MKKNICTKLMAMATMVAAMAAFAGCEEEDSYLADTLRGRDWQGYVGAYYENRWGLSGSEYATVMRFESKDSWYTSGRGYELDYDTRSPRRDYAYCTFKWFIVDGEITLIYDDSKWDPIYIVDYSLNSSRFRGYIYDGTNRRIQFSFESDVFDDWGYYNHSGGYGGFSNQNYYRSRETRSDDDATYCNAVPFEDRSEQARLESGEPEAVSICSGAFCK